MNEWIKRGLQVLAGVGMAAYGYYVGDGNAVTIGVGVAAQAVPSLVDMERARVLIDLIGHLDRAAPTPEVRAAVERAKRISILPPLRNGKGK